jgi:hypothetical protein
MRRRRSCPSTEPQVAEPIWRSKGEAHDRCDDKHRDVDAAPERIGTVRRVADDDREEHYGEAAVAGGEDADPRRLCRRTARRSAPQRKRGLENPRRPHDDEHDEHGRRTCNP